MKCHLIRRFAPPSPQGEGLKTIAKNNVTFYTAGIDVRKALDIYVLINNNNYKYITITK